MNAMLDCKFCTDAESKPEVMSGVFVVKIIRVPVQAVLGNADYGYTAEQIASEFYHGLPVELTRRLIELARKSRIATPAA